MAKNRQGKRGRRRLLGAVAACLGVVLMALGMAILLSRPVWIKVLIALERDRLPVDRVVVDAGHGGGDPGAASNGLVEKEVTRDIALRLAVVLKEKRIPVTLTRSGDQTVSLQQRAKMANRYKNPLFVSIHCNFAERTAASGIETIFYTAKPAPQRQWRFVRLMDASSEIASGDGRLASKKLAGTIQSRLIAATKANDRGLKETNLWVLRMTRGAAVLVEVGFLSNETEAELLGTEQYRAMVAEAIGAGINEYLLELQRSVPSQDAEAHGSESLLEADGL